MRRRTRIKIDYKRCGDGKGVDPRDCGRCLRACEPAVFLLHQTLGAHEPDRNDPQTWRVTPMWATLCTRCGACVEVCPEGAIRVRPAAVTGAADRAARRAPVVAPAPGEAAGPAAPPHRSQPGHPGRQGAPGASAPAPALAEEADS